MRTLKIFFIMSALTFYNGIKFIRYENKKLSSKNYLYKTLWELKNFEFFVVVNVVVKLSALSFEKVIIYYTLQQLNLLKNFFRVNIRAVLN